MLTPGLVYRPGLLSTGALGNGTSHIWSQWPVCRAVAISVKEGGNRGSAIAIWKALWLSMRATPANNCSLHTVKQPHQEGLCGDLCDLLVLSRISLVRGQGVL